MDKNIFNIAFAAIVQLILMDKIIFTIAFAAIVRLIQWTKIYLLLSRSTKIAI